jgi:hypothetical protein
LFFVKPLTSDGDTVISQDRGNAGLRDAVALADMLGGFTALVPPHDIGDGIGGQEPFGARFWTVRLRQKWSG